MAASTLFNSVVVCTILLVHSLPSVSAFVAGIAPQRAGGRPSFPACRTTAARSSSSPSVPEHAQEDGKHVVVVGGGIGGLSSAFDARHILRPHDKITVVSDRRFFQFTPSNPWVALRIRTPEDISLPLASILPRHKIEFVHGKAVRLRPQANKLQLENGTFVDYDYLIIATGPRLGFDEIPGSGPDGASQSICTTPHASLTASAVDQLVNEPGPVVIGATQGSSCFGPAYEFAFLLHHELDKRGHYRHLDDELADKCHITFVTPEPYVGHLGLNGAGDSQQVLSRLLREKNIDCLTNCQITRVDKQAVRVKYVDRDGTRREKSLPSKLTMLIPPFRGMSIWSTVPGLTDDNGLILVNEHQQSTSYTNIFGVGVCVSIPPLEETPVPTGIPKTGYMIESMGTAAVRNIRAMIDVDEKHYKNSGHISKEEEDEEPVLHHRALMNGVCITDFGNDGAVFVAVPQVPPRKMALTIRGKIATLAKIAFEKYFLHKIESGDTDPYYEKYMLKLIGVERSIEE